MKNIRQILGIGVLVAAGLGIIAADHIDAPAVTGATSDITDFYAFQAEDPNNIVFMANVQGLMSPSDTAMASFDENVLTEINIDTDGDNIEDLVIQAIPRNTKMFFIGPMMPDQTGLVSTLEANIGKNGNSVKITPYGSPANIATTKDGMKLFAGPRDDPFFFDFVQFNEILSGNASGFDDPGTDTFAGTNVLTIAIELPKSMVGGSGNISAWVETKRKQ